MNRPINSFSKLACLVAYVRHTFHVFNFSSIPFLLYIAFHSIFLLYRFTVFCDWWTWQLPAQSTWTSEVGASPYHCAFSQPQTIHTPTSKGSSTALLTRKTKRATATRQAWPVDRTVRYHRVKTFVHWKHASVLRLREKNEFRDSLGLG